MHLGFPLGPLRRVQVEALGRLLDGAGIPWGVLPHPEREDRWQVVLDSERDRYRAQALHAGEPDPGPRPLPPPEDPAAAAAESERTIRRMRLAARLRCHPDDLPHEIEDFIA